MIYTITTYFDPVGSKFISNKCPNCGNSESLELNFYQKRIESPFSTKITKNITGILYCHNTETEIPPVQWSEDIERIFNTEKQYLKLRPKKTTFNKWFYGLLAFLAITSITIVSFLVIEANRIKKLEEGVQNVSTGNTFEVFYSNSDILDLPLGVTTWFLVKKIDGDTIWLQRHNKIANKQSMSFELNTSNFTEEVLRASLKEFKKQNLISHDYSKAKFTGLITNIKKK